MIDLLNSSVVWGKYLLDPLHMGEGPETGQRKLPNNKLYEKGRKQALQKYMD